MIKQAPSPARIASMLVFALSCFGILLFLWLSFGGPVPLRPEGYRVQVAIPEASTLAVEADVRTSGVTVGKVKSKELDKAGARTLVEIEIESRYAPIPKDARATLRQKTLLGESYVELTPGHDAAGALPDGGRVPDAQVAPSVELDEIAGLFDERTREAFGDYANEVALALGSGRARDLNAALGNLAGFAGDGDDLLAVLDREGLSLQRLVRNTGVVFGALSEREGALRELIDGSSRTFGALAARDDALAETIAVMPAFLDETRATAARLEGSLARVAPLARDLGPAADDLRPALRDLADLSPDLEATFRGLDPLIAASRTGLPGLERTARAAEPVVEAIHPFAQELNPVASMLSFYQERVAAFLTAGGAGVGYKIGGEFAVANSAVIHPNMFLQVEERPDHDRGNSYPQPNWAERRTALGNYESFDCSRARGRRNRFGDVPRDDAVGVPLAGAAALRRPPCFVAPASLYDGQLFNLARRGEAPVRERPRGTEGRLPTEGRP